MFSYLTKLSVNRKQSSLEAHRDAISHLFLKHGVADPTRSGKINELIASLGALKPSLPIVACTAEERYRLISSLEHEGLGVRDRVLFLLISFSRWAVERIHLIDVEDVSFSDDGVTINAGTYAKPVVIGRHMDPHLDLEPWMRILIDMVGNRGPLFRLPAAREMRFSDQRMRRMALRGVIRNAATVADVPEYGITRRLRLLFDEECKAAVPDIVLLHYDVLRNRSKTNRPLSREGKISLGKQR